MSILRIVSMITLTQQSRRLATEVRQAESLLPQRRLQKGSPHGAALVLATTSKSLPGAGTVSSHRFPFRNRENPVLQTC